MYYVVTTNPIGDITSFENIEVAKNFQDYMNVDPKENTFELRTDDDIEEYLDMCRSEGVLKSLPEPCTSYFEYA